MFNSRIRHAGRKSVILLVVICLAISLISSSLASETRALTASAESLMMGGSTCSDFMDGFTVGMGIGVVLGCVWCGVGAVAAKLIGSFC